MTGRRNGAGSQAARLNGAGREPEGDGYAPPSGQGGPLTVAGGFHGVVGDRLGFRQGFIDALLGRSAITVTGRAGRDALEVALRIQGEIERALRAAAVVGGSSGA